DNGARRLTEDLRRFNGLALRLGVDDLFYEVMEQTHYLDLERFLGPIERLQVSANVQRLAELIAARSEEHTSELQSPDHLVSRRHPVSRIFPYTTLFRSRQWGAPSHRGPAALQRPCASAWRRRPFL